MAEPLTPQEIARRTFDVARRGYEQHEVRGFLHEVSTIVEKLSRDLMEARERAERAETKLQMADRPDEAMLLEVLGEETTRVLTSARESAAEIRSKAEEAAARIIEEATAAAAETRAEATKDADAQLAAARAESESILESARTELERRSAEAEEAAAAIRAAGEADAARLREEGEAELAQSRTDAEEAREAGRREGRHMVAEAQIVRERILRDLAARRKKLRQQVEKLNAGRERLLEAYETVRHTIDEATGELNTSIIDARYAADAAARQVESEPEDSLEDLEAEVAAAGVEVPEERLAGGDASDDEDSEPAADDSGADAEDASGIEDDHDEPGPFSGEVPAVPAEPRTIEVGDTSRGRRRRKKGVVLPPAELTVLEAPSEAEGVRVLAEPAVDPTPAVEEVEAEPSAEDAASAPDDADVPQADEADEATAEAGADEGAADHEEPEAGEEDPPDVDEPAEVADEEAAEEPGGDDGDADEPEVEEAAPAPAGGAPAEAPAAEEPADEPTEEPAKAESVFARLRAEAEAPAEPEEAAPATDSTDTADETEADADTEEAADASAGEPEEPAGEEDTADASVVAAFEARAAATAPVVKDLSRQLKRLLADEQNEVLDLLRRTKPKGVDDVLPEPDDHAARWADAVAELLGRAASSGAEQTGSAKHDSSTVADLADELARNLGDPLRDRIDRSFAASDGNLDDVSDRVRALYREWKGQRLSEAAEHFVAAAYARGVFDGIGSGAPVRWVVDPSAGACPDCDDNVLGGVITKGEEFPTGNACAPAHPGCHCLVLPAI